MQYTETELAKLIETVESEFTAHLSKAEALAKSEDAPPSKEKKPEDKKPEAEAKPAAEGAKAPEAAPAPEAKPEAAGAAPAAAPAIPGAAPAADHGYDDEDMQHMDQMYASMSEPELKAHHDSIRKCLDAKGGAAQAGAAPAAAAPIDKCMGKSEAGKSEISAENPVLNSKAKAGGKNLDNDPKNGGIEGAQPHDIPNRSDASKDSKNLHDAMAKAEAARRNGGKIDEQAPSGPVGKRSPASTDSANLKDSMEKSEKEFDLLKNELEAEKAKTADLKKNFDAAQEFLTKLVGKISAPKGKAITEVAALQKTEDASEKIELSKVEIRDILYKKASDPKLEKSDREAINKFYDGGQIDIKQVSHLLK